MTDTPDRGKSTLSFEEMKKGQVGLCFATVIARYVKQGNKLPGWHSPQQAWAHIQGQVAWYRQMEREGHLRNISNYAELEDHLDSWNSDTSSNKIGYLMTLEGADSIVEMDHLYMMYDKGLRAIGPAHYGPGTYAFGTDSEGSIGNKGRELLTEMEKCGIALDVTHLSDTSFWEAIDHYKGPVWASHSNCRSLVPHQRQFSDEQLKELINRNAVIGASFEASMLVKGWQKGKSDPSSFPVLLSHVVDHMDHICQLSGNCNHVGLGSDLDGGFGKEQCPYDLESIADLQKIPAILQTRGYSEDDIRKITSKNWINALKASLP